MGIDRLPNRPRIRPGTPLPVARCPMGAEQARTIQQRTAEFLSAPPRFENGIGLPMLLVPAGEYRMGNPKGRSKAVSLACHRRLDWLTDCPRPQHVRVEWPFYVAAWPITRPQYAAVMGAEPGNRRWRGWWRGKDRPADSVLWREADEFCRRLSEREGRTYRLPTMAEWEYCCRAGSDGRFCFGHDPGDLAETGWHAVNSGLRTRPVGRLRPNAWGLHDVHGNVFEWCEDPMDLILLSKDPDLSGDDLADFHLARGGAHNCSAGLCAAYLRAWFPPSRRYDIVGFRVVCEA